MIPKKNWLMAAAVFLSASFFGCTSQAAYLKTSDGFSLAYELKKAKEPKGAVLLLHGLGTNLDEWYTFGKALRKKGWTTLAVDLRGHGDSLDFKGEEIHWTEMTDEGLRSTLNDVEAAVHLLKEQAPEAEQNLWVLGSSFGSSLALTYAAAHPEMNGAVLFSPGINFGGLKIEEPAKIFTEGAVLVIAAEDDPGAVRESRQIMEWIPSGRKKLLTFPKGGHGAELLDNVKGLKEEVLGWLSQDTVPKAQKNTSV